MTHPCDKEDDINQIKTSVQRIEAALLGDKFNPDGLVTRVNKLEKKAENTDRKVILYTSLGTGIVGTLSIFFKTLFK